MKARWILLMTILVLMAFSFIGIGCGDDDDPSTSSEQTDDDDDDDDDTGDDDDDDDDNDTVNPFLNPTEIGPYLVGNTTFFAVDMDRDLSCGEGNRRLVVEVWYPASEAAADMDEQMFTEFFLDKKAECIDAFVDHGHFVTGHEDYPTGSYRDAPINNDAPPMPILVFSHGFTSVRYQNYNLAVYLASHGYIVVSPDHTCNALVAPFPDGVIHYTLLNTLFTIGEREADISSLIDIFTSSPPPMFEGRLDKDKVGIFGHSFGGFTVTEVIKDEPRAKALLQLASFGLPNVPPSVTAPSLFFYGQEDGVMEMWENWHQQNLENMPSPKWELEFYDTGHFAFSDYCVFSEKMKDGGDGCGVGERLDGSESFTNPSPQIMREMIHPYATAFFGAVLFDYPALWDYMDENHFEEYIEYFSF